MAAFNKDSKRIFDLYVNRYLLEADGEAARSKEADPGSASKESDKSSAGAAGGNAPAVGGSEAGVTAPGNAVGGSEAQTYNPNARVPVDATGQPAAYNRNTQEPLVVTTPVQSNNTAGGEAAPSKPANMSDADFQKMLDQQYSDFQKQGSNPQMSDADYQKMLDQQYSDFQKTGQTAAAPAATAAAPAATPQTPPAPPSKEDIERYGRTGAELRQTSGKQFMTRADRLDQAKVDKVLGAGKYKAGTEEANLALADYFRKNPATVTPGTPGSPAGSTAPAPTGSTAPAPSAPASTSPAPGVNVPKPGATPAAALIDMYKKLSPAEQAEFKKNIG